MKAATALILLVGLAFCRPATTLDTTQTDPVAKRVAAIVASGNQDAILDNFYYADGPETARARDRAGVGKLLSILYTDFGAIRQMSRSRAVPTALDLLVAPGTVEQLNREGSFKRYYYDAEFANYGDGFVYIDIFRREDGSIGLRSVSFALPVAQPDTAARVRATGGRMVASLK